MLKLLSGLKERAISYMPPLYRHQDLSRFLSTLLDLFVQFIKLGVVQYAPFRGKIVA